jgi:NAD-dependent dihydropyrimidine dehydrogenase PreA subunit
MMGQLIYLKDVVTLKLDQKKCMRCGMCLSVCPHAVLSLLNSKVEIENRDACMECGACAQNCPTEAISVHAGVGCAAAVIRSGLGLKSSSSCCTINPRGKSVDLDQSSSGTELTDCC